MIQSLTRTTAACEASAMLPDDRAFLLPHYRLGRIRGCIDSALISLKHGDTTDAIRVLREALEGDELVKMEPV